MIKLDIDRRRYPPFERVSASGRVEKVSCLAVSPVNCTYRVHRSCIFKDTQKWPCI